MLNFYYYNLQESVLYVIINEDYISYIIYLFFLYQFLNPQHENPLVLQLKHLASKLLFALSQNNFTAVFNRISAT